VNNVVRAVRDETPAQKALRLATAQAERERLELDLLRQIQGAGLPEPE
jgi:hypothetical protein